MSVATSTELKGLTTQLEKAKAELSLANNERVAAQDKYNSLNRRVNEISQRMKELTRKPEKIIISEHALLRYVERVMGVDLEKIKETILSNRPLQQTTVKNFQTLLDGHNYVVKDNVLVTIE